MDLFEVSMAMVFVWPLHNGRTETEQGCRISPAETRWWGRYVLSLSLSYVSVCLYFFLYLCLIPFLFLFLFVRVIDILLTVEQGRGLPRTLYIYECG